jgi:hypothetical protein
VLSRICPFNCFSLPEALAREVLVEWLGLKQVVRLDSAFCCHVSRAQFISLAYGQLTTFALSFGTSERVYNRLLRWVVCRGAQLDGVLIYGGEDRSATEESLQLLETFLAMSGSAITWVSDRVYFESDNPGYQNAVLLVARSCPNVQKFFGECRGCRLQDLQHDESLVALTSACQKLTKLSLDGMKLSEQGLAKALQNCVNLEHLDLLTECQILPVETALPSLKSIQSCSYHVADAVLIAIGRRCAKLETLRIFWFAKPTGDYQMTDVGVRAVLQGCPLLRDTDFEYAQGISTELRVELARRLSPSDLYLRDWFDVSEDLAQKVMKVSPNLITLDCKDCDWLTDDTLAVCAQYCPLLQNLSLGDSHYVTTAGVRALLSRLGSKLRFVELQSCPQLGDETVLAVAEHCPLLERCVPPPNVSNAAMAKLRKRCVLLIMLL